MPSKTVKEIESVTLMNDIEIAIKHNRKAMRRLRLHKGLQKMYLKSLKDVELVLTNLKSEVQNCVDGMYVEPNEDPEENIMTNWFFCEIGEKNKFELICLKKLLTLHFLMLARRSGWASADLARQLFLENSLKRF